MYGILLDYTRKPWKNLRLLRLLQQLCNCVWCVCIASIYDSVWVSRCSFGNRNQLRPVVLSSVYKQEVTKCPQEGHLRYKPYLEKCPPTIPTPMCLLALAAVATWVGLCRLRVAVPVRPQGVEPRNPPRPWSTTSRHLTTSCPMCPQPITSSTRLVIQVCLDVCR